MTKRDRNLVVGVLAALGSLVLIIALVSLLGSVLPHPARIASIFAAQLLTLIVIVVLIVRREKKGMKDAG